MKISQIHAYDYFARWTADADESGIRVTYSSPVRDDDDYYLYEELDPKTKTCRHGYSEWRQWGWFFMVLAMLSATFGGMIFGKSTVLVYLSTSLLVLSLFFFSLRFVKRTCLLFFNKNGSVIFYLAIPHDQSFADFITRRIRRANGLPEETIEQEP